MLRSTLLSLFLSVMVHLTTNTALAHDVNGSWEVVQKYCTRPSLPAPNCVADFQTLNISLTELPDLQICTSSIANLVESETFCNKNYEISRKKPAYLERGEVDLNLSENQVYSSITKEENNQRTQYLSRYHVLNSNELYYTRYTRVLNLFNGQVIGTPRVWETSYLLKRIK